MCHPIPLPVYHHTECLDYGKPAGLCFASRRKYGEKNSIAMIAGRHIFTPLFWRERHSWHNIGQEIWGQDELFYVMLWHKRGEWWGIGMDGSLLILWSLYSPSFSARLRLLRKSVVTEWDFLSLNHTPLSLSLAAPRGPECRWWFFFIISPPVWFQIHLSTFFWRFEALILPALTKIFLSFEKWVIMNWWVMFAVTFENYSFF